MEYTKKCHRTIQKKQTKDRRGAQTNIETRLKIIKLLDNFSYKRQHNHTHVRIYPSQIGRWVLTICKLNAFNNLMFSSNLVYLIMYSTYRNTGQQWLAFFLSYFTKTRYWCFKKCGIVGSSSLTSNRAAEII